MVYRKKGSLKKVSEIREKLVQGVVCVDYQYKGEHWVTYCSPKEDFKKKHFLSLV